MPFAWRHGPVYLDQPCKRLRNRDLCHFSQLVKAERTPLLYLVFEGLTRAGFLYLTTLSLVYRIGQAQE